jgi:hypothetical protein
MDQARRLIMQSTHLPSFNLLLRNAFFGIAYYRQIIYSQKMFDPKYQVRRKKNILSTSVSETQVRVLYKYISYAPDMLAMSSLRDHLNIM